MDGKLYLIEQTDGINITTLCYSLAISEEDAIDAATEYLGGEPDEGILVATEIQPPNRFFETETTSAFTSYEIQPPNDFFEE